jgi:hypothetical protein
MGVNEQKLRQQGFQPYRKKGVTYAKKMQVAFKVRLKNEDIIYGKPGDYVCTDVDTTERWIVEDQIFERTYKLVPLTEVKPHQRNNLLEHYHFRAFRKTAITWARQLAAPMVVHTLEGDVRAQAGDYLCIGAKGEQWPQMRDRFEANYELAPARTGAR